MPVKKAFFDDLWAQDDIETTDESEIDIAVVLQTSKKKAVTVITPGQKASVDAWLPTAMGRTMSSPVSLVRTSRPRTDDVIDRVKETPIVPAPIRPQLSKQTTAPAELSRVQTAKQTQPASEAGKKRKRDKPLEPLPESQQIFRGKFFCEFSIGLLLEVLMCLYIHSLHTRQRYKPCSETENSEGPGRGCCVDQGMESWHWHHSCDGRQRFDLSRCYQVSEGHHLAGKFP